MKQVKVNSELIALACGILGLLAAVFAYWLIVPGLILGAAAVVLGWRARRSGSVEGGSVAVALGVVAILLVPAVWVVVDGSTDGSAEALVELEKEIGDRSRLRVIWQPAASCPSASRRFLARRFSKRLRVAGAFVVRSPLYRTRTRWVSSDVSGAGEAIARE